MNRRVRRRGLYLPFILLGVLIAAYSAYWLWARSQLAAAVDGWIASQRAAGVEVGYESRRLGGYPYRFALRVEGPRLSDPRSGQNWQGERLDLVMQPWNWRHVIVRAPGLNRIDTGRDVIELDIGTGSAASLSWTPTGLRRLSVSLDEVAARRNRAPVVSGQDLELHLRPPPSAPDLLQVQASWQELTLADRVPELDFLGRDLGPSILRMEATKAWRALGTAKDLAEVPDVLLALGGEVRVPQLILDWGPARLGARGEIALGPDGALVGDVGLRLEDAGALLDALRQAGRLTPELERGITAVGAASRDGRFLNLSVRDGGVYFLGQRVADMPAVL